MAVDAGVLSVDDVVVKAGEAVLVNHLSLTVEAGEIVSIIGPNGAGKSSLIKAISGDLPVFSGCVSVCGKPMQHWHMRNRAKHMATLPQQSTLDFPFTVEEVVALSRIPHDTGYKVDQEIVSAAIHTLAIEHLSGRDYTQLSGGEKQRTQLARVLAQIWRSEDASARIAILDEPVTALDLGHQQQLMSIIKRFAEGRVGVLMVLHDINLAGQYSDKIVALRHGELVCQGPPSEVITKPVIETLFNATVHFVKHPSTGKTVVLL